MHVCVRMCVPYTQKHSHRHTVSLLCWCQLELTLHTDPHNIGRMFPFTVGRIHRNIVNPCLGKAVILLLCIIESSHADVVSVIEVPYIQSFVD